MVVTQDRSLRKPSGGRNTSTRPRRVSTIGNNSTLTGIGKKRLRTERTRGGSRKVGLLSVDTINVWDPDKKKHVKATLKSVKASESNQNYIRRNIITKGTVVNTDKGSAKVTNRPGQEGIINAILVKE